MVGPDARDRAADRVLERLRRDRALGQEAAEDRGRRARARAREPVGEHRPRAGADAREAALEPEHRAAGAGRVGGRAAVRPLEALEDLAVRVGDHEPRRDAGREERAHHRSRRCADDVVGAARVPAGLARERLEAARQPRAAHDAARPEYEPDLHSRMNTGAPTGTSRISARRSRSVARRQPVEAAWPIVSGRSVPWIAMRSPPAQPGGRLG